MYQIIKKHITKIILAICTNVLSAAMMVVSGYLLSLILDSVTVGLIDQVIKSIMCLIGIWIVTILILYLNNIVVASTIKILNCELKNIMSSKLSTMTYKEYRENEPGGYVSWFINDANRIESNSFSQFFDFIYYVFSLIFSFIAILVIHPFIAVCSFLLMILMLLIPNLLNNKLQEKTNDLSNKQELFTQKITNIVQGIPTFLSLNKIEKFRIKMNRENQYIETEKYKYSCYRAFINTIITTISVVSQVGLDLLTAYFAVKGLTNVGSILSMGNISGQFFGASTNLISSYMMITSNKQLFDKYKISDETLEVINKHVDVIQFENVSFSYDNKKILEDFSYTFMKNKKYMIVGESGKGKSTVAKLCANIIHSQSGSIIYFDENNNKFIMNRNEICPNIIYLDQTPFIFNESIRYNLSLGEDIEEDKLIDILDKFKLTEFIEKLPNGLDTLLEEGGKNMSGGEKQRLVLSRAMLMSSDVLIIDEGTASLDKATTKQIESIILSVTNKLIIYITHHYDEQLVEYFDSVIEL